jgi:hypothetical protein
MRLRLGPGDTAVEQPGVELLVALEPQPRREQPLPGDPDLVLDLALLPACRRGARDRLDQVMRAHLPEAPVVGALPAARRSTGLSEEDRFSRLIDATPERLLPLWQRHREALLLEWRALHGDAPAPDGPGAAAATASAAMSISEFIREARAAGWAVSRRPGGHHELVHRREGDHPVSLRVDAERQEVAPERRGSGRA